MIHYIETKESIFVNNTLDNILYIGDDTNLNDSNTLYYVLNGGFREQYYVPSPDINFYQYIIDIEYDFKRYSKTTSAVLLQFCYNIRQFKINELVSR